MVDFTNNLTVNYVKFSPETFSIPDVPNNSYDEPIKYLIKFDNQGDGIIETGNFGTTSSCWIEDFQWWAITGSRAEVNNALADMTYLPDSNQNTFNATIEVYDGNDTLIGDGTIEFVGEQIFVAQQPTFTQQPPILQQYQFETPLLPDLGQIDDPDNTLLYIRAEILDGNVPRLTDPDRWGKLVPAWVGRNRVKDIGKDAGKEEKVEFSYYGTIDECNSFLRCLYFDPQSGYDGFTQLTLQIDDGQDQGSASVIQHIGLYESLNGNILPATQSITANEDTVIDNFGLSVDLTDALDYPDIGSPITLTFTPSDPNAGKIDKFVWSTLLNDGDMTVVNETASVVTLRADADIWDTNLGDAKFDLAGDYELDFTLTVSGFIFDTIPLNNAIINVDVVPVQDVPVFTNQSGTIISSANVPWTEDQTKQLPTFQVSDPDLGETVTLDITVSDTSAGTVNVTNSGGASLSFLSSGVQLSGDLNDVNFAMQNVEFNPAQDYDIDFTITYTATDSGNNTITLPVSMNVSSVPDAPAIQNKGTTTQYTPGQSSGFTNDPIVIDPDTVSASGNFVYEITLSPSNLGSLNEPSGSGYNSSFNPSNNKLTINGTLAGINTAIPQVQLSSSMVPMTVSNFGGTKNWTEDTTYDFSAETTPPQVTQSPTAGLSGTASLLVTDPTNLQDTGTISLSPIANLITVDLTLSDLAAGTFNTPSSGQTSSTFNASLGRWRVFGANETEINNVLNDLEFIPAPDYDIDFNVNVEVSDNYGTIITDTMLFSVTQVGDAPTLQNTPQTINFTTNPVWFSPAPQITDIDTNDTFDVTLDLIPGSVGQISEPNVSGATINWDSNNTKLTIQGDLTSVNNALTQIDFIPLSGGLSADNFNATYTYTEDQVYDFDVDGTPPQINPANTSNDAQIDILVEDSYGLTDAGQLFLTNQNPTYSVTVTFTLNNTNAGSLNEPSVFTPGTGTTTSFYFPSTGEWSVTSSDITAVNDVISQLEFTPVTNFDQQFTIDTKVEDNLNNIVTGTITFNAIGTHDPAVITNLNSTTVYCQNREAPLTEDFRILSDPDTDDKYIVEISLGTNRIGSISGPSFWNPTTGVYSISGFGSGVAAGAFDDFGLSAAKYVPGLDDISGEQATITVTDGAGGVQSGTIDFIGNKAFDLSNKDSVTQYTFDVQTPPSAVPELSNICASNDLVWAQFTYDPKLGRLVSTQTNTPQTGEIQLKVEKRVLDSGVDRLLDYLWDNLWLGRTQNGLEIVQIDPMTLNVSILQTFTPIVVFNRNSHIRKDLVNKEFGINTDDNEKFMFFSYDGFSFTLKSTFDRGVQEFNNDFVFCKDNFSMTQTNENYVYDGSNWVLDNNLPDAGVLLFNDVVVYDSGTKARDKNGTTAFATYPDTSVQAELFPWGADQPDTFIGVYENTATNENEIRVISVDSVNGFNTLHIALSKSNIGATDFDQIDKNLIGNQGRLKFTDRTSSELIDTFTFLRAVTGDIGLGDDGNDLHNLQVMEYTSGGNVIDVNNNLAGLEWKPAKPVDVTINTAFNDNLDLNTKTGTMVFELDGTLWNALNTNWEDIDTNWENL